MERLLGAFNLNKMSEDESKQAVETTTQTVRRRRIKDKNPIVVTILLIMLLFGLIVCYNTKGNILGANIISLSIISWLVYDVYVMSS